MNINIARVFESFLVAYYVLNAEKMPQTSNQFLNTQIIPILHKKPFDWEQRGNSKRHFDSNQIDRFQLRHMNRKKMKIRKKRRGRAFPLHFWRQKKLKWHEIFIHSFDRCKFNVKTKEIRSDQKIILCINGAYPIDFKIALVHNLKSKIGFIYLPSVQSMLKTRISDVNVVIELEFCKRLPKWRSCTLFHMIYSKQSVWRLQILYLHSGKQCFISNEIIVNYYSDCV